MATRVALMAALLMPVIGLAHAYADTGTGDLPRTRSDIPASSLTRLGQDSFRFTAWQWKRLNWVLEMHRDIRNASGNVSFYLGQKKVGWLTLYLPFDEYDQLMAKIDATLAAGDQTRIEVAPGEALISVDGESYVSERRKAGKSIWISTRPGFHDPNENVRDLLLAAFQNRMACAYRPVFSPCTTARYSGRQTGWREAHRMA
jgi:hypothetical protein